jgi:hypothetical protein
MIWMHHRCNFWVWNEIVSSSLPGPRLVTGLRKKCSQTMQKGLPENGMRSYVLFEHSFKHFDVLEIPV